MNNSITEGEVRITNPKVDDLNRIASALERIADVLEKENTDESIENMRMNISVDAEELAKEILKRHGQPVSPRQSAFNNMKGDTHGRQRNRESH